MSHKLNDVLFFVEATDCERQLLWEKYHEKYNWEEISEGFMGDIGAFGGEGTNPLYTISVSFTFARFEGKLICFYDVTSRYVDHNIVKEYIESYQKVNYANAQNFHQCIIFCTRKSSISVEFVCEKCGDVSRINNPKMYVGGCSDSCTSMHQCDPRHPVFYTNCKKCGDEIEFEYYDDEE